MTRKKMTESGTRFETLIESRRALYENSPLAILEWDWEGKLLVWAGRAEELFGWKAEEVVGKRWDETGFFLEDDLEMVRKNLGDLRSRRYSNQLSRHRTKDGRQVYCEWFNSILFDDGKRGGHVISYVQDVTDRRRAEKRLIESHDRFEKIAAQIPGGIGQRIVTSDGKQYFSYLSPGAQKLLGVKWEDAQKDAGVVSANIHPEDLPRFQEAVEYALKTMKPVNWQGRFIDGPEVRWLQIMSQPTARPDGAVVFDGFITDVTWRKLAEEALAISEERLQFAIDGAQDGVWDWDVRTGKVIYSERWAAMLGYDVRDLPQDFSTWESLVHPDDIPASMEKIERHLSGEDEYYETEFRMKAKNGEWRWILARGKIVKRTEDGEPLRMTGTHKDIQQDKIDAETRVRLERQLAEARTMQALGVMAGGVAHDFNNILTAIIGFSELLKHDLAGDEESLENVNEVLTASKRAKVIIQELITFSRTGRLNRKTGLVSNAIDRSLSLAGSKLMKNVEIETHVTEDEPRVLIDKSQIDRALMNLVLNSAQAIGMDGGRIDIRVEQVIFGESGEEDGISLNPGRYVRLVVEDNGAGMTPDVLKRVFEPFYSTKPSSIGIGLGLAVVQGIVSAHHGAITIESEPGEGTGVSIFLPCVEESDAAE
ncbi:MAG: PAS domain S-box protein [Gemmatimonadetes bacterium]|nr:PAS domain S-box protein [Gemmatimonadota bacterium]